MSLLFRIIYAAHANGTHHKLALDALNAMQGPSADAWRNVFLKHVEKFLEGSKAPDNTFKDFKNHVLHVGETYWGGAPEKVSEWYQTTVSALQASRWEDAAYAAGVLSHYYTDPVMPFHTGQTEAENSIHRATEWSINRSYDSLRKIGEAKFTALEVAVPDGPNWLKDMSCNAAEFSHQYYEKLIAHYDIHKGTVRPEEGLDDIARNIVAELLMYAATGFGHILDRAIAESGVAAPQVSLSVATVLATLKIPQKWVEKKLTNAEDRKIVQAMYDELKATGRVDQSLTQDDRTIRDLHAVEVQAPKIAARKEARAQRQPDMPVIDSEPNAAPAPAAKDVEPVAPLAKGTFSTHTHTAAAALPADPTAPPTHAIHAVHARAAHSASSEHHERTSYLSESDPLEAAPSIGPKMAQRFAEHGIHTVGEFLGHDPRDMASLLDDKRIDADTLEAWQDQAHLVIKVPGLRGTHAQLLVGAGYRWPDAIAESDPVDFAAGIMTFAATDAGKRILRDGNPPDIEKIKDWVSAAKLALAA